jgi:hypothetical protein
MITIKELIMRYGPFEIEINIYTIFDALRYYYYRFRNKETIVKPALTVAESEEVKNFIEDMFDEQTVTKQVVFSCKTQTLVKNEGILIRFSNWCRASMFSLNQKYTHSENINFRRMCHRV